MKATTEGKWNVVRSISVESTGRSRKASQKSRKCLQRSCVDYKARWKYKVCKIVLLFKCRSKSEACFRLSVPPEHMVR